MEGIFEFLKGFDLQHIISTFAIVYFMTHKNFAEIKDEIKDIKKQLQNLDMRLTRLEGRFEERGYWESRNKKVGEE